MFLKHSSLPFCKGFKFLTISATDADDPKTQNANIRYSIINQNPALPQPNMFEINPDSGEIQVRSEGFDREVRAKTWFLNQVVKKKFQL